MKKPSSASATLPRTGTRRAMYHLGVAPGDVHSYVLLLGDPDRARRVRSVLDPVDCEKEKREFYTVSGRYRGLPVSVVGTGIGCDNTEIAVVELSQVAGALTLVRAGTCGALQRHIGIGDLVVTSGAMRLESTSLAYVEPGYPAVAHHAVVGALVQAARAARATTHVGITATAAGFYGAQGRSAPGFPALDPQIPERLARQGVLNFEMEASTLLTLASLRGFRAGVVCTAFASRPRDAFIAEVERKPAEDRCVQVALEALRLLAADDAKRPA
jgi:uridine phosphorylase